MFLSSASFAEVSKYVVFFAESLEIPQSIADKIFLSGSFCLTVPVSSVAYIPENLKKLVLCGKLEPAISFMPEPVLPIFAMLSRRSQNSGRNIFEEYILNNITDFRTGTGRKDFGVFLGFAEVSHDVLRHFAALNLKWINADNIGENIFGAYDIDGITVFAMYKDFPYNNREVLKWLATKSESVIPVLLTNRHLQDVEFMERLIEVFDDSEYVKPVTPLYIVGFKKTVLSSEDAHFQQSAVDSVPMEKLCSMAELINNYVASPCFEEHTYINARDELVYLCSNSLLTYVSSGRAGGRKAFDAVCDDICRILGVSGTKSVRFENSGCVVHDSYSGDRVYKNGKFESSEQTAAAEKNSVFVVNERNEESRIESILDGIRIRNKGQLRLIEVVTKDNNIKISFSFERGMWDEKIVFIDFYIDLNNIDGMGSTTMLAGVNGFLTRESGWEYALRVYRDKAILYKHFSDGASSIVSELPFIDNSVLVPQKYIRGNPVNWGYQAVVVSDFDGEKVVVDFLNQNTRTKEKILSVKPFQISAVRCIIDSHTH
jgi:hypothetical protein